MQRLNEAADLVACITADSSTSSETRTLERCSHGQSQCLSTGHNRIAH